MGCGSSSQPGEVNPEKLAALEGNKENVNDKTLDQPQVDTAHTDRVETFQGTPTPSPAVQQPQHSGIIEVSTTPAAYRSNANGSPHNTIAQKSPFATPMVVHPPSDLDPFSPSSNPNAGPSLAPGYIENENTRKIGGFDPEAFRKANQKDSISSPANDWASINTGPNNGGNMNQRNGGGYQQGGSQGYQQGGSQGYQQGGSQGYQQQQQHQQQQHQQQQGGSQQRDSHWNQQDYIQSDDIFSTHSPQAYQNNSRMEFREEVSNDPFRAPGGLGHDDSHNLNGKKHITTEDDALMDDILGELDEM